MKKLNILTDQMYLIKAVLCTILQGVESERCASFTASMEAGKPIYTQAASTIADGKSTDRLNVI